MDFICTTRQYGDYYIEKGFRHVAHLIEDQALIHFFHLDDTYFSTKMKTSLTISEICMGYIFRGVANVADIVVNLDIENGSVQWSNCTGHTVEINTDLLW